MIVTPKVKKELVVLFFISIILLGFRVNMVDQLGDAAIYRTRSIGPVDYMFSTSQTTPLDWFDELPWWSHLSHHDHPILLFWIFHLFLLFGTHPYLFALPNLILAAGSICALYLYLRSTRGLRAALLGIFFLYTNSAFVWAARHSFLEMGVIFFSTCTLLLFDTYSKKISYPWLFSLFFGLTLLTKYTAFFVCFVLVCMLAHSRRNLLHDRQFRRAFLVGLLFLIPAVLYNVMLYKTRGHFDLQFSRLLGTEGPWTLSGPTIDAHFLSTLYHILAENVSFVYLYLLLAAGAYALYSKDRNTSLPFCAVFIISILLLLTGTPDHFVALLSVFFAWIMAIGLDDFFTWLRRKQARYLSSIHIIFAVSAVYLLMFIYSSHMTLNPFDLRVGVTTSRLVSINHGISQLDAKIGDIISESTNRGDLMLMDELNGEGSDILRSPVIIVYDDDIDWFIRIWLFGRRVFYDHIPIFSVGDYTSLRQDTYRPKTVYYISGRHKSVMDPDWAKRGLANIFEFFIQTSSVDEEKVFSRDGRHTFSIFELSSSTD